MPRTFTITSLRWPGGTGVTPIFNAPEVATPGLSCAHWRAVLREDKLAPRSMLPLSFSRGHRVIDGARAALFAGFIRDRLQAPEPLV